MGTEVTQKERNKFGMTRQPKNFASLDEVIGIASEKGATVTAITAGNNVSSVVVSGNGQQISLAVKRPNGTGTIMNEIQIATDSVRGALRKIGALRPTAGIKHDTTPAYVAA